MSLHGATIPPLIVVLKTITLLLGGVITLFAYRAYNRTGARSLGFLSLGFAVITLGTLLAGIADQLLQADLQVGLLIESALITVGFAIIVYSLYTTT
ncbi:MAG: hypothetical protein V5A55_07645 [Halovenus sp.]